MHFRLLSVFLFITIVSCNYLVDSLSDEDISQYISAYDNLAIVSNQLEVEREKSNAISVLVCSKCLELMDKAVQDAGYAGLSSFFLMDLRISHTMRYVIYLEISQLVGQVGEKIGQDGVAEKVCSGIAEISASHGDEEQQMKDHCRLASALSTYIEKLSTHIKGISEKLIVSGDLDIVQRRFEEINKAFTDSRLIDDLNHAGGGEWDD